MLLKLRRKVHMDLRSGEPLVYIGLHSHQAVQRIPSLTKTKPELFYHLLYIQRWPKEKGASSIHVPLLYCCKIYEKCPLQLILWTHVF